VSEASTLVTTAAPGHVVVNSPLTFATARRACAAGIECFTRDGGAQLVVDCTGASPADSAGLAVLIEWRRWATQHGRHLTFANMPVQISAIAHLSEVTEVLADAAA
jgi:phospholipid transport system transporter-binding protein